MKKERQAEVARAIVEIVAGEEQGIRRLDLIKRLEAKIAPLPDNDAGERHRWAHSRPHAGDAARRRGSQHLARRRRPSRRCRSAPRPCP